MWLLRINRILEETFLLLDYVAAVIHQQACGLFGC